MARGSISTYRLRSDLLEAYFRSQFPGHRNFNVQVGALLLTTLLFHRTERNSGTDAHVQLSVDGRELYTFDTPTALTKVSFVNVSYR